MFAELLWLEEGIYAALGPSIALFTNGRLSVRDLRRVAFKVYVDASPFRRWMQALRPYICPFDELVAMVPVRARVLDVGCGAGLFLVLLDATGRVESGYGFDASGLAIRAARRASEKLRTSRLRFEQRKIEEGIPRGDWQVVSVIDVLHHITPARQATFLREVAAAVPAGGQLLLKDMVCRPVWRATANRLHDLLLARQWVHHVDPATAEDWLQGSGLVVRRRWKSNDFWYGHWAVIFERTQPTE